MLTDVDRWQFFPQLAQDTLEFREHRRLRGSLNGNSVQHELVHAALCKLYPKAKQAFCHLGSHWNWIEIWNLGFVWLNATRCTLSFFSSLKLTLMFGYGYFFYSIWDWFPIISWDFRSAFSICFWLGIAFVAKCLRFFGICFRFLFLPRYPKHQWAVSNLKTSVLQLHKYCAAIAHAQATGGVVKSLTTVPWVTSIHSVYL